MDHKTEHNSGRSAGNTSRIHWRIAIRTTIAVIVVLVLVLITSVISLRWINPPVTAFTLQENWEEIGPGTFGAGKASDAFFNIPVSQLEADMSARMAAVLPSPNRMRVEPPSPYTLERSRWILQQMTHLTGIAYFTPESTDPDQNADPLPFEFDVELDLDLDSYTLFNDIDSLRYLGLESEMPDLSIDADMLYDLDPDSLFDLDLELDTSGLTNDIDTLFSN